MAATDFFRRQEQARRSTLWLRVLFAVAMLAAAAAMSLTLLVLGNVLLHGMLFNLHNGNFWHAAFIASHGGWYVVLALAGTCLAASAHKAWELRGGGVPIAQALGGTPLLPGRGSSEQRQLLNIVEEMALAARIPSPQVFVLEKEQGINAFAAGRSPETAVIGITGGALAALSRDELQAVVAHEFSHILNGDMVLNTRLVSWLHGLLMPTNLAQHLRQRRRAKWFMWQWRFAAWCVYAVGSIGMFVGRLLQAAISRSREELADASAVQFTRNPAALNTALLKIEAAAGAGRVHAMHAPDIAHMFFAESRVPVAAWLERLKSSFMTTHPSMLQRMRALEPGLTETSYRASVRRVRREMLDAKTAIEAPVVIAGETLHAASAAPQLLHERMPELLLSRLSHESRRQLEAATSSVATDQEAVQAFFIGALLAADTVRARAQLIQMAPLLGAALITRAQKERARLDGLPPFARLPALAAVLPRLMQLPDRERARLVRIARAFQTQILPIDTLRFAVARLIAQQLAVPAATDSAPRTLEQASASCGLLCSLIAGFSGTRAAAAFRAGMDGLYPPNRRPVLATAGIDATTVDAALAELVRLPPVSRRALCDALVRIIGARQSMEVAEFNLLRFVSLHLSVPIPVVPLSVRSAEHAA